MSKASLQRAIEIAGSQTRLAEVVRAHMPDSKVAQAHISGWLNTVKIEVPPAEVVLAIAMGLDWQITPHELRPDLYPNPLDALPAGYEPSPNPSPRPASGPGAKSASGTSATASADYPSAAPTPAAGARTGIEAAVQGLV